MAKDAMDGVTTPESGTPAGRGHVPATGVTRGTRVTLPTATACPEGTGTGTGTGAETTGTGTAL